MAIRVDRDRSYELEHAAARVIVRHWRSDLMTATACRPSIYQLGNAFADAPVPRSEAAYLRHPMGYAIMEHAEANNRY
jgi:hypothetical protein